MGDHPPTVQQFRMRQVHVNASHAAYMCDAKTARSSVQRTRDRHGRVENRFSVNQPPQWLSSNKYIPKLFKRSGSYGTCKNRPNPTPMQMSTRAGREREARIVLNRKRKGLTNFWVCLCGGKKPCKCTVRLFGFAHFSLSTI